MHSNSSYGTLCSLFYDATKTYASDKEVDFYAQFIESKHARVLEAMSGSGRLLIPLVLRGYTVDGIDNSPAMLERCTQRCKQLTISPELYEQSLEQITINHMYSTVTIAVGSFQLIVSRSHALEALKQLSKVMHSGASLLIDTFKPETTEGTSDKAVRLNDTTVLTLTTQYTYTAQEKRADALCTYELYSDGILQAHEQEVIQVTWYTHEEIKELLSLAGFELIKEYTEHFPVTGPSHILHALKRDHV